MFNDKI